MIKKINILILSSILLLMSFINPDHSYTLIVFEGSDWCSACRKFEKEILKDSTVITYLEDNNITVKKIDFPQRKKISKEQKKMNERYAEKYNFKGVFPTIILSSSETEQYHTLSSPTVKPHEFVEWLETSQNNIQSNE